MKKMMLIASLLFATSNVYAIALQFKFDVFSSGSSLYACNAGLKHEDYATRVCYNPEDLSLCKPSKECKDGDNCQANCLCTGGINSGAGEYRYDQMTARVGNWVDQGMKATYGKAKTYGALENDFASLVTGGQNFNNVAVFDKMITDLVFELGSERYGAEYFVDICFRGPQIDYTKEIENDGVYQAQIPQWSVLTGVTVTDQAVKSGLKYSKLSGLSVQLQAECEVQSSNNKVNYNNHDVVTFNSTWVETDSANIDGTFQELFSGWLEKNNKRLAPKFCKFRYTFKETKRSGIPSLRKWQLQKAQVCTYTELNEDADSSEDVQ